MNADMGSHCSPDRNDVFISPTTGIVVCHDPSLIRAGQISLKLFHFGISI